MIGGGRAKLPNTRSIMSFIQSAIVMASVLISLTLAEIVLRVLNHQSPLTKQFWRDSRPETVRHVLMQAAVAVPFGIVSILLFRALGVFG
jgi:hypothetical protein